MNLQSFLQNNNLDAIIIPSVDEFFGEYVPLERNRLLKTTGFSGSNGVAVIGINNKVLLTDGRYLEQAEKQIAKDFKIIDITKASLIEYLNSLLPQKIGFFQELHTFANIEKLTKQLVPISCRELDKIIEINTNYVESFDKIIKIDSNKTGINTDKILAKIKLNDDEAMLICDPASVCWLLNIRGKSVEYCGIFNTYLALFKDRSHELINDLYDNEKFTNIFKNVKTIKTDFNQINFHFHKLIADKAINIKNPFIPLKAIKNSNEIEGMKKANAQDSIAISQFISWIKRELKNNAKITEIEAIAKLLEFRKMSPNFIEQSFATICGAGSNSSIIHYHSTEKDNKMIEKDSIVLVDSGGHYDFYGTSDITRTICTGEPSPLIKHYYTLVLKCHIAVATAVFLPGTNGSQIDAIARMNLWKDGQDYGHGTGHGVGCYLSVHEGPCSISKQNTVVLEEGMIVSNEPGFYLPGQYGIRLENLMLIKKHPMFKNMLCFETISFVEFDADFIDYSVLTRNERTWLDDYTKLCLNID